ncbi:hypothetical protein PR048_016345 [Dryococelus australis]|uniref:Uncharacterized protein n=1 Tax=Dryococelus australis TaxID=614101 RepID=A0ABQ9HJG7_9NEOP|nr:hypothetical protein PR048_016345 [Dryococelus australis]
MTQCISGLYKTLTSVSPTDFEELLNRIEPHIPKQEPHFRSPISAQDRLAVTLRFLTTGDSYTGLQYIFIMSKQSMGKIIPKVCAALVQELEGYLKTSLITVNLGEMVRTLTVTSGGIAIV